MLGYTMQLSLVSISSANQKKLFHQFTRDLYANDSEFISHLDQDIEAIFDPLKNELFRNGGAQRWLAYDANKLVGRIAAFYNKDTHQSGIGFFDCIDSQEAANALFDQASLWLREHGLNRVEAPVNFGERDKYWGLMVQGFKSPSYQENYNAPYYQALFENYGFTQTIEQTTSEARPEAIDYQKYKRFTNRLQERGGFRVEHFKQSQIKKFVADFTQIYNQAWAQHEHFVPFTEERVMKLFKEMKPIIQEDILLFLYEGEKPIAFYLSVIDVNQIVKHVNGNMNWWGKLKFLWYRRTLKIKKIRGIIFGVIPEFQDKGVYSILIMRMYEVMQQDADLQSTELAWIGDFNPKMHALFESLGAAKTKVHYTYEKLL
jgi:hypothetical protein